MAVQTTSTLSASMHIKYVRKLLKVLQPRLQLYKLGKKGKLDKGNGTQCKWLIYAKASSSTTPLSEGTNPSEASLSNSNVTATIAQYGQYSKNSDLLEHSAIEDVAEEHAELWGKAGAETVEDLIASELDGSLTVRRVNGRANDDAIVAGDTVNLKEFLKAKIALKGSYVGPHEMGDYAAVLHPDNEYDLLSESNPVGWLGISQYAPSMKEQVVKGEIGRVFGMRFMVSDKMAEADNSGSISVKNNYLIGEECFGICEIAPKGKAPGVELIIKKPDRNDTSNPLNMYGTVGYKLKGFVAKNFAAARGILLKGATSFS